MRKLHKLWHKRKRKSIWGFWAANDYEETDWRRRRLGSTIDLGFWAATNLGVFIQKVIWGVCDLIDWERILCNLGSIGVFPYLHLTIWRRRRFGFMIQRFYESGFVMRFWGGFFFFFFTSLLCECKETIILIYESSKI